jgi:Mrp family chromosome partitioning ATPase
MDPAMREQWAFWTLRQLQSRLAPNAALICGFTSAQPGEGRATWMNLLAEAARKQGLLVVCLDARNHPSRSMTPPHPPSQSARMDDRQALSYPLDIVAIAKTPARRSAIQADLDRWIWSLEKRHQWESGMAELATLDNLVFFAALPTATEPAMALLAESLPHVIWIGAQGESDRIHTRHQVSQLKNSRIRLAGAVLNKAKA